jgi:hypothetical protein
METPLPHMFILNAASERYVLCISEYKEQNRCWKLMIMNDSKYLMENCRLMNDGTETAPKTYLYERESSRHSEIKYYESSMKRTRRYINIVNPGHVGSFEPIYEYTMTSPCKILCSKFYRVVKGEDSDMKWHFRIMPPEPTIPTHVQNAYIEYAISKNEVCPITLEPFERGNVSCTPCGHLFSKSVLGSLKICPSCRKDLTL